MGHGFSSTLNHLSIKLFFNLLKTLKAVYLIQTYFFQQTNHVFHNPTELSHTLNEKIAKKLINANAASLKNGIEVRQGAQGGIGKVKGAAGKVKGAGAGVVGMFKGGK